MSNALIARPPDALMLLGLVATVMLGTLGVALGVAVVWGGV